MKTNAQDRVRPVLRPADQRTQACQPSREGSTGNIESESIDATELLKTEPVGSGRLRAVEREQTAIGSFEPLIDTAAAAAVLKVHRKTLERMALRGEIPSHKVGRFWRFRASELDEWLRSGVNYGRQPRCTTTF